MTDNDLIGRISTGTTEEIEDFLGYQVSNIILENLESNNGNKTKTADILKIGRKTLHRKLNEYGLVTSSGPEEE